MVTSSIESKKAYPIKVMFMGHLIPKFIFYLVERNLMNRCDRIKWHQIN